MCIKLKSIIQITEEKCHIDDKKGVIYLIHNGEYWNLKIGKDKQATHNRIINSQ